MGNVLSREKREQVIALGRLGWPLRRIGQATGVRRETAGDYLRSAGIVVRSPGTWGPKSLSKAATSVTTGFLLAKASPEQAGKRSAGISESYRETIALDLEPGHNATGSLVQNLRAGFVPPEPPNRTSRYSATAARVSGRFRAGKPGRDGFIVPKMTVEAW